MPWLWNLWLDRRGRSFNPDEIVGPTASAARSTLKVSEARPRRPAGCPSTLARQDWAPRPRPTRIPSSGSAPAPSSERRRGRNRGLDSVARVTPPGNLMPRAALRWLQPSLPWAPGPGRKGEPDPSGETQDGVRAQAVWPVSPPSAATVTSARHMPYRASPSKASQVGLG